MSDACMVTICSITKSRDWTGEATTGESRIEPETDRHALGQHRSIRCLERQVGESSRDCPSGH